MFSKARSNLWCVFNFVFCLFSFQQSKENPPQSSLQSDMGKDRSTSENKIEYSEHSSDAVDMKFSDGKGIRFIRTLSWVKERAVKVGNLKDKKQSSFFIWCTAFFILLHFLQNPFFSWRAITPERYYVSFLLKLSEIFNYTKQNVHCPKKPYWIG